MSMPIALQVYSVRDDASVNLEDTLKKIKEMGYDGVEFAGLYDYDADTVKKLCEKAGLIPISAHVPIAELIKAPDETVLKYKGIGCKYIAIPYLSPDMRPESGNFDSVIENIKMIGNVAKKHGIQLLYHNHDFEFVTVNGEYALDLLYRSTTNDELKTELDTCWVNVGGENPAEYLKKYSGRAPIVHLKDFFGEKSDDMYELIGIDRKAPKRPNNFELRPVGYGIQNFPEILEAANVAGAEWLVVEQDNPSMGLTPLECAAKSREYLKTLGY